MDQCLRPSLLRAVGITQLSHSRHSVCPHRSHVLGISKLDEKQVLQELSGHGIVIILLTNRTDFEVHSEHWDLWTSVPRPGGGAALGLEGQGPGTHLIPRLVVLRSHLGALGV